MAGWHEQPRRGRTRHSLPLILVCVVAAISVVVFAPTPKPGPAVPVPAAPSVADPLPRGGASPSPPGHPGVLELVLPIVGLVLVVGLAWWRLSVWLDEAQRADLSSTEGIQ